MCFSNIQANQDTSRAVSFAVTKSSNYMKWCYQKTQRYSRCISLVLTINVFSSKDTCAWSPAMNTVATSSLYRKRAAALANTAVGPTPHTSPLQLIHFAIDSKCESHRFCACYYFIRQVFFLILLSWFDWLNCINIRAIDSNCEKFLFGQSIYRKPKMLDIQDRQGREKQLLSNDMFTVMLINEEK